MTISSQSGIWSFAVQPSAFRDKVGGFDVDAINWYKYRTPRVTLGTIQDQQVFPLEVGGTIVPTGAYKQAQFYAGDVDILPRLENTIGLLLYGALGAVSSVTGVDVNGNAVAGVNTHTFSFKTGENAFLPWMASRCVMPGATTADDFGELGYDCKVTALQLTIPQMGKVAMRLVMQGRAAAYDNDPQNWDYDIPRFEDSESVPDAGSGHFKIGGTEYPALGVSATINNNLTTPQQEMVVGSFNPDDFIALTRDVSLQFTYKYEDSDLAQQILTGSPTGTTWTPLPFFAETSGADYAVDMYFEAPDVIPGTSTNYAIRLRANKVTLARVGAPQLVAGGFITENYVLTVLEPDDPNDPYFEVLVQNGIPDYAALIPSGWDVLEADNTGPTLTMAATAAYSGTAVALDGAAALTDPDSNWGDLRIDVALAGTNVAADDFTELDTSGDLSIVGDQVRNADGYVIAYVYDNAVEGGSLQIHLTQNAVSADVDLLLQSILYDRTSGSNPTDEVTATVTVTDDFGNTDSQVVTITHS